MNHENKSFNKVLFVGTGGGNDVYSTVLAMLTLRNQGWKWNTCSIAGVLSPFHIHKAPFAYIPQLRIRDIQPDSTRHVVNHKDNFEIKFVDAAVANMVQQVPELGISKVFGLSLHGGSKSLAETFKFLAKAFDYIVLVDVGGDIFYQGKTDTHVLSPFFDATVLKAFVDSKVSGILFEAGPGTDGELDPESLEQAFKKAQAVAYPLSADIVAHWDTLYRKWIETTREGKTVPVTISAFQSQEPEITLKYRARAQLGKERVYAYFDQRIKSALCKQFFLVNPANIINPFAVACTSPLDWMKKTQVLQHRTNCEPNMQTFGANGILYHILTPSILFKEDDRKCMIEQGLKKFAERAFDRVIMFPEDWQPISEQWKPLFRVVSKAGFVTLKLR